MVSIPDDLNDLLDDDDVDEIFTLEEEIAAGSFGTVYQGTHIPSGDTMAIKIIAPDEDELPEDLMIEIALLKNIEHPNIVKYYGGYRKGDEIFIAMELCDCSARDIFEVSEEGLLEKEIALICRESLKGLEHMHKNNFIHRDIKGANILLTAEGGVKLVDFGVSSLDAAKAKTFVGTPYWMAPEVIDSKNGMKGYSPNMDVWSIGITAIELAETVPPLSYINPMRALFQIPARDSPVLEHPSKWSPEFNDFIAKCLEKDPKKRGNCSDLLKHPFMANCDGDPQIIKELIKRKKRLESNGDLASDDSDTYSEDDADSMYLDDNGLGDWEQALDSPAPARRAVAIAPESDDEMIASDDDMSDFLGRSDDAPPAATGSKASFAPPSSPAPTPDMMPPSVPAPTPDRRATIDASSPASRGRTPTRSKLDCPPPPSHAAPMPPAGAAPTPNGLAPPATHERSRSVSSVPSPSEGVERPQNGDLARVQTSPSEITRTNSLGSSTPSERPQTRPRAKNTGKSTLHRPTATRRGGNRLKQPSETGEEQASKDPDGKKAAQQVAREKRRLLRKQRIKQQMKIMRKLQAKLQAQVDSQAKKHERESSELLAKETAALEKLGRTRAKKLAAMKATEESSADTMLKTQQKEQRALLKQQDTEKKALVKELKEQLKKDEKTHADKQKLRAKEQKDQQKQAKKEKMDKGSQKKMVSEHKVELLLNDLLFQQTSKRRDLESTATQNRQHMEALHKQQIAMMQARHKHELESKRAQHKENMVTEDQKFKLKGDWQSKFHPIQTRQQKERHELRKGHLEKQLTLERDQQRSILEEDQKLQMDAYKKQRKKQERNNQAGLKALTKTAKSKSELKTLQAESKSKFLEVQQEMDTEFNESLAQQKQEEEELMQMHQKRQRQNLQATHLEEQEHLANTHLAELADLQIQQAESKFEVVCRFQSMEAEIVERHQLERKELLDSQLDQLSSLQKEAHRAAQALKDEQYQEAQQFIGANIDKLLPGSETRFREVIDSDHQAASDAMREKQGQEMEDLQKFARDERDALERAQAEQRTELQREQNEAKADYAQTVERVQATRPKEEDLLGSGGV